jgi:hypothetical protein
MMRRILVSGLWLLFAGTALAAEIDSRPFAGGTLTIVETDDGDKILAFDGKELVRDWYVDFDRMVAVSDTDVALYVAGPGGNACGVDAVIVWKPEGGELKSERFGDCGAPAPAADGSRLVFVPWVMPGETLDVTEWTPTEGFRVAGAMTFKPQPGTTWTDLQAQPAGHPMDLFANEAFYAKATAILGDDLSDLVTSLGTSAAPEDVGGGLFVARGCIPHACGSNDGFVAVDPKAKSIWFAQQQDDGSLKYWPALDAWPKAARDAVKQGFQP